MSELAPKSKSAFRHFLASLRIGAARVRLILYDEEHPRGSEVTGVVTVTGGAVSQRIDELIVRLIGDYTHDGSWYNPISCRLAYHQPVQARERLDFPFSLPLPDDIQLTVADQYSASIAVSLSLADTLGNRHVRVPLNVVPQPEITAVFRAFPLLNFRKSSGLLHPLLEPDPNLETTDVFHPTDWLQKYLSAVSVNLHAQGTCVFGKLLILLCDRDKYVECPFQIPREELITAGGQPNPEGAIPYLKQSIAFALALPEDPQSWMLRPSISPSTDPNMLLRPTMPTTSAASDDLLRPTTPPEE